MVNCTGGEGGAEATSAAWSACFAELIERETGAHGGADATTLDTTTLGASPSDTTTTRMAQSAGMDLLNLVPAAAAAGQMGIATEGPPRGAF